MTPTKPLIISQARATQTELFDDPLATGDHGRCRYLIGDFIERLTSLIFQGQRLRTDSRSWYCSDVRLNLSRGPIYLETKAVGLSHQAFVYKGRVKKDIAFAKTHDLRYCIWHHHVATKEAQSVDELKTLLLLKMQCVYLVPFCTLLPILLERKEEKLNSGYGRHSSSKCYGAGYRIPLSLLEEFKFIEWVIEP